MTSKEPQDRSTQPQETPPKAKKPKTGGRKKGTPNKNTWHVRQSLDAHGFDPIAEFISLYKSTSDLSDKWTRLTYLFRYVYPQLKDVDKLPDEQPSQSTSSPADVSRLLAIASSK